MHKSIENIIRIINQEPRILGDTKRELRRYLESASDAWAREADMLVDDVQLPKRSGAGGGGDGDDGGDDYAVAQEATRNLFRRATTSQLSLQQELEALTAACVTTSLKLLSARTRRAEDSSTAVVSGVVLVRAARLLSCTSS